MNLKLNDILTINITDTLSIDSWEISFLYSNQIIYRRRLDNDIVKDDNLKKYMEMNHFYGREEIPTKIIITDPLGLQQYLKTLKTLKTLK